MHKDFADWYRAASIEPDSDALPKRWAAVEAFEVKKGDIGDAARIFYGKTPRNPEFLPRLRADLQTADAAVQMSGNDREIAVLAGAILVDSFERHEPPLSFLAAYVTVCPAAKNLNRPPIVPAIPELAMLTLEDYSARRFIPFNIENELLPQRGAEELKRLCQENDLTKIGDPLAKLFTAVRKVQTQIPHLARQSLLQSEETNMLWWLLGQHSRDTKRAFATCTLAEACLIAGKELADLTKELPGPPSAPALLDAVIRAGRSKLPKAVSIESAVNDAPAHWKQELLSIDGADPLSDLAPITSAIKAAASLPPGENWSKIYMHAVGIDSAAKIAPTDLAQQVYLESLMFRSWAANGDDE